MDECQLRSTASELLGDFHAKQLTALLDRANTASEETVTKETELSILREKVRIVHALDCLAHDISTTVNGMTTNIKRLLDADLVETEAKLRARCRLLEQISQNKVVDASQQGFQAQLSAFLKQQGK